MKRSFAGLAMMLAVACSRDKTTPTPEPPSAVTRTPEPPSAATPTPSTPLPGKAEVDPPPGQSASPSTPRAEPSPFDTVDRLASSGNQKDAFKVLDEANAAEDQAKIAAQWSCYEALALFTLNQVTSGSVAADHCIAKVPAGDQAIWKARLDTAKANAGTRVKQVLARDVAQECAQAIAHNEQPVGGGCATCIKVGAFSDQLEKNLGAKELKSVGVLHPAMANRVHVLTP